MRAPARSDEDTNMCMRLRSLLLAVPLAGFFNAGWAAEQTLPSDPKQRLEALQQALVTAAMEGQTRVQNAAWVDQAGQLHENTRITSDMKVSNLRVLNYLMVDQRMSASIATDARGVTPDDEVCRANRQRYQREATLDTALRVATDGASHYYWQALAAQARTRFAAQAEAGRQWKLAPSTVAPATNYERQLVGYLPDVAPYQMLIEVLPPGALGIEPVRPQAGRGERAAQVLKSVGDYLSDAPQKIAPVPFVLRLSVTERVSRRLLWQDAVPLFFPEQPVTYSARPLPAGLLSELDRVVARWQHRLDGDFGCRPQTFSVMQETRDGWVINAGQGSGLSVGDQLLMMDRDQLPARILEPDSGERLALVEVASVAPGRSVVRRLAGAARLTRPGDWVATPF